MSISLTSTQGYLQVLAFPFQDRSAWKKVAIGSLIGLCIFVVPVLPILLLYGYTTRIMKHILQQGGDPYLPEWDRWDMLLADGLRVWGAVTLVNLPLAFLSLTGIAAIVLPWAILLSMPPEQIVRLITPAIVCTAVGALLFALALLLSMPVMLMKSAVIGHVVRHNSFQAMFQASAWWDILRAGLKVFLTEVLVIILLNAASSFVLAPPVAMVALCFPYPFLVASCFFLITLYQHVFAALAYREGLALQARSRSEAP